MRELILLRHAHAEPGANGQADIDRPLSAQGHREADAAGAWLREHGLLPDRILCSPSRRTRETADAVIHALGPIEQRLDPGIYEATAGALAAIADANTDSQRLLLVGHNPGMERLAALLHSGQSGDYRGMPTGSIAVLSLPADAAIEPGIATLSAFWWP